MKSLCGGGSNKIYHEPKTIRPEDVIRKLRDHIDQQEKRELFLEHKLKTMAQEAKEKMGKGDKRGAVALLKKRKLYQAEQQKISNIKMTLETQAIHLESAASSADAFHAMSAGNKTMKLIRQDIGVDKVDDMMVDIQEEMQMAEEVNNAMGQAIDPLMGAMDDDELMRELEDEDRTSLATQFDYAETGKKTYYMPQKKAPSSGLSTREEEDYRRLQAELAM